LSAQLCVAAWGAGRMGRGIAHTFAFAGHKVLAFDSKPRDAISNEKLKAEFFAEIRSNLQSLVLLKVMSESHIEQTLSRVEFVPYSRARERLLEVSIVFEGVPEVLSAKQAALEFLSHHVSAECIIASTTSTMLSTELAARVKMPERFLNAHWLNPAYLIPLVEVSPHGGTSIEVIERLNGMLKSIGKKPVLCKAAPGFIVPRLQALVMNEAARMIEQGIATPEAIDEAIRYGFGPRYAAMGVVEFIDVGGLDILYHASKYLAASTNDNRYSAPDIVNRYMVEGRLGLKTGAGFYDYRDTDVSAYRQDVMARQVALLKQLSLVPVFNAGIRDEELNREND
jgi:3-hydroxybutyryl-CoA dehydrogenase